MTLYSLVSGQWLNNAYTYTAYNPMAAGAVLTSPTPSGSTLTSNSVTFTWNNGTGVATNFWIDVGSTVGGNQYYQSGSLPNTTLSATVSDLPEDGSNVYVTLYSFIGGSWTSNAYTFIAASGSSCLATITSPAAGTNLTANSDLFSWTPSTAPGCSGVVTAYWLDAGTTDSENFYDQSGNLGLATSTTETNLPPGQGGGQPPPNEQVQMTLWNLIGGTWIASPEVGYCANGYFGYPACTSGGSVKRAGQ